MWCAPPLCFHRRSEFSMTSCSALRRSLLREVSRKVWFFIPRCAFERMDVAEELLRSSAAFHKNCMFSQPAWSSHVRCAPPRLLPCPQNLVCARANGCCGGVEAPPRELTKKVHVFIAGLVIPRSLFSSAITSVPNSSVCRRAN